MLMVPVLGDPFSNFGTSTSHLFDATPRWDPLVTARAVEGRKPRSIGARPCTLFAASQTLLTSHLSEAIRNETSSVERDSNATCSKFDYMALCRSVHRRSWRRCGNGEPYDFLARCTEHLSAQCDDVRRIDERRHVEFVTRREHNAPEHTGRHDHSYVSRQRCVVFVCSDR